MPRKLRVQYPGGMYHVMSRGDQRDDIFLDDADRYDFVKTLAEACGQTDLVRRPKNEPLRLAIAVRLRRETTFTLKAITARVHLGTYHTANARLHQAMGEGPGSSARAQTPLGK